MPDADLLDTLEELIRRSIVSSASELGLDPQDAERVARRVGQDIALEVCRLYGGEQVYISMRAPIVRRAIAKSFTGDNARALAHKYGLSVSTVYAILREVRASRKSQQLMLPF